MNYLQIFGGEIVVRSETESTIWSTDKMWLAEAFDLAHKALIYLRLRYSLFFECKRYPIFAIGYYYQKMFACQEI